MDLEGVGTPLRQMLQWWGMDPAPGTSASFEDFPNEYLELPPAMVRGDATFSATATPSGGVPALGAWVEEQGTLGLVALERMPIPNMALNATFYSPRAFLSESGALLLSAQYTDDDDGGMIVREQEGFWRRGSNGALELVACDDLQAPGMPAGVAFGDALSLHYSGPFDRWDMSPSGRIGFSGTVKGAGVTVNTDEGVWVEDASGLVNVVSEGDPAPGLAPGFRFGVRAGLRAFGAQQRTHVRVNDNGSLLFGAGMHGNSFDRVDALWKFRNGALELVAVAEEPGTGFPGQQAPGLPQGVKFMNFFLHASINAADDVAFQGFTPDDDGNFYTFESGIWWQKDGALELVARTETPLPGVPGAELESLVLGELLDNGALTMTAHLVGPAVTEADDNVLLVADPLGNVRVALREGDEIDVNGDGSDLRTVASFVFGGMNQKLRAGVLIRFTDGSSGLFEERVRFGARRSVTLR